MRYMRVFTQGRIQWLGGLLVVLTLLWPDGVQTARAQNEAKKPERTEQIEALLQQAEEAFKKKEFIGAYEVYRRVLSLDSTNQHAREKVYEIARVYQAMENIAREEKNEEQAQVLYQQYRGIVRYLLSVLTKQLNVEFHTYSQLNLSKEAGDDIIEQIVPVLHNLIDILTELKTVYEQFPREEAGTEPVIERLKNAILKYEQELADYQDASG